MRFHAWIRTDHPAMTTAGDAIDAPTWFDARRYAESIYGERLANVERCADDAPHGVELEWRGTDAGRAHGRALWVRRAGGAWVPFGEPIPGDDAPIHGTRAKTVAVGTKSQRRASP